MDGSCSEAAGEAASVDKEVVPFGIGGSASSSSFPGDETLNQHK